MLIVHIVIKRKLPVRARIRVAVVSLETSDRSDPTWRGLSNELMGTVTNE